MLSGSIWAIGCMSGTSIDGIDAAALQTDGIGLEQFGVSKFRSYTENERNTIRQAFDTPPDGPAALAASDVVTQAHIDILQHFDQQAVIGFHGQTIGHYPECHRTHQTGSAKQLAETLARDVVADFRSQDMQNGGQGAPLTPFYHFALTRDCLRMKREVLFLNLGGVANITLVDPRYESPETRNALLAFDSGPANGPIDDWISKTLDMPFDKDGEIAAQGTICGTIVDEFLSDPYFSLPPPKSLDRNHFASLVQRVQPLDVCDAAATLTACVAQSVKVALRHLPSTPELILVCGGGRANPTLLTMLSDELSSEIKDVDEFGIDGDMLEAQAFAYLAVRVLRRLPTSAPSTTGCRIPTSGGQVYRARK